MTAMAKEFEQTVSEEPIPELSPEVLKARIPELDEAQTAAFIKYYKMLVIWNRRLNLTRITDPVEVAEKHFADSVLGSSLIPEGARVIDVGTGAGFPGIPLNIVRPDITLVMVDSLGKRVNFLNELVKELGIEAEAIHARAEDAARDARLRAGFDIALSRAVAPMNVLLELTVPFVKVGGESLMYKAASFLEELSSSENALKTLSCAVELHEYSVPWGSRTVVCAKKLRPTDKKYPRKAGFVEKAPL